MIVLHDYNTNQITETVSQTNLRMLQLIHAAIVATAAYLTHLAQVALYSPSVARQLANMCQMSYEPSSSIYAWNCPLCQRHPLYDIRTAYEGQMRLFTGYSPSLNGVVVVFRGSSNLQNWIHNFDSWRTDYYKCTGCSVHQGFYNQMKLVQPTVLVQVRALVAKYKDSQIYVTGQSLGGAIAVLSALELKDAVSNHITVYTYGQPRVGSKELAKYTEQTLRVYRVIYNKDMVPHLPPDVLGFWHGGVEIWYNQGLKSYKTCQAESKECANSQRFCNFDDHQMKYYVQIPVDSSWSLFGASHQSSLDQHNSHLVRAR